MSRVVAIARNTFRETIRDRILGVIVLFALLMIVGSLWLASISLEQEGRMMKDFGLVAVSGFGLIVAVFVAASLVRKEVEKRTVFVLFSKPVGRGEFICGKFLGLCLTMAVVMAGMGVFLFGVSWWVAREATPALLLAVVLVYLQLVVVMAATVFFSTVTSTVLATVLGICTYFMGVLSHNVLNLTDVAQNDPVLKGVAWALFVLIPNLSAIDVRGDIVNSAAVDWAAVGAWSGYLLAYTVVVLLAATAVFRRREF
jgi:ABC-type transport system involved in multi-copper enzyme maturation permease subunit